MSDVDERAILAIAKADRKAKLDWVQFTRLSHVNRMKYDDDFTPPEDHEVWVERQISRGKSGKPLSVRGTVHDAIEELTEERQFFDKSTDKVLVLIPPMKT